VTSLQQIEVAKEIMRCRTRGFLSLLSQHLAEHAFFYSDRFIHCDQVFQLFHLNISTSGIPLTKNIYGDFDPNGIVYRDCQFSFRSFRVGQIPNEWRVRNNTFIQDNSSMFLRRSYNKHYYF
jgi:hypothetical protein